MRPHLLVPENLKGFGNHFTPWVQMDPHQKFVFSKSAKIEPSYFPHRRLSTFSQNGTRQVRFPEKKENKRIIVERPLSCKQPQQK